ncbi:MAG: hypothetical protein AB1489_00685 [Acidobacteriota bacterium]
MLRKLSIICILLFSTFGLTACDRHRELVTGLTEKEAQRICVLLQRNGLIANAVKSGSEDTVSWSVTIETPFIIGDEAVNKARYILDENDLPRARENPYLSVFKSESLIPTQTEEELRKLAATQEAIALMLEKVNGVVSANVNVVMPNPNPLVDASKQSRPSASVLLKYNTPNEPYSVSEIRSLVASAIEGLDADRVQVVMKAVPAPNINQFDNLKNRYIRLIFVAAITIVLILSGLLAFSVMRIRKLGSRIAQLERNQAIRPVGSRGQPATAANAAAR